MSSDENSVSNDVVLAEVRGLASTVEARFDGMQREHGNMKQWMGRLSDTLDRYSSVASQFVSLETRAAHTEAEVSDHALDIAEMRSEIGDIKTENAKSSQSRKVIIAVVAFFSAAITALIGGAIQPILEKMLHG